MSLPSVTSTVFTRSSSGQWEKLTEVSQQRTTSEPAWKPDATYIEALNNAASGHNQHAKSKNLVLKQGTEWKPTRLTRISSPQSRHPIVLALAVNTDYASTFSKALSPGAYNGKKQFAFFDYRQGILNCIYEPQRSSACTSLAKAIRSSGLIASLNSPKAWPTPRQLKSRIEIQQPDGSTRQVPVRIVITRMTDWNAMAAISIEEDLFKQALMPVKEGIHYVNIFLTMTGLLLIGGCAFAAWRLSQRINGQLMLLANAANEIAEGHTNLQLEYKENDSIGALVNAFNRMASAVTDREDSLRERIETLEININHNLLVGQVCSITDSPEFSDLSRRAQLMRERRYRQLQKQNNNDES
jgi:HAMP domain-containing protein